MTVKKKGALYSRGRSAGTTKPCDECGEPFQTPYTHKRYCDREDHTRRTCAERVAQRRKNELKRKTAVA